MVADAEQWRERAVAGDDDEAHRQRADRRLGGALGLRAAAGMAQAAERRTGLRLAGAGAAGGGSRDGRKATGRLTCTRAGPLAPVRRRAGPASGNLCRAAASDRRHRSFPCPIAQPTKQSPRPPCPTTSWWHWHVAASAVRCAIGRYAAT